MSIMLYTSEAHYQSHLTAFLANAANLQATLSKYRSTANLPPAHPHNHIHNTTFFYETKHKACHASKCTPIQCTSRIPITKRELTQAKSLLRASGISATDCLDAPQGPPSPSSTQTGILTPPKSSQALSFKIPDDSLGFKPFDGFASLASPSAFIVAFSCDQSAKHVPYTYLLPVNQFVRLIAQDKKSFTTKDLAPFKANL